MSASHQAWAELAFRLNNQTAVSQLNEMKSSVEDFSEDLDSKAQRLTLLWTYGLQITNMLLRGFSKHAKSAQVQAGLQVALSAVQMASSQTAVYMTTKQALAAFAQNTPWGVAQGILLSSIAASMEVGIWASMVQKQQAQQLQAQAESYRLAVEAYRS